MLCEQGLRQIGGAGWAVTEQPGSGKTEFTAKYIANKCVILTLTGETLASWPSLVMLLVCGRCKHNSRSVCQPQQGARCV